MHYIGDIYRPPSEAYSLILQTTVGCSHNRCTFCGNYTGKKFFVQDIDVIKRDIDEASRQQHLFDKVFLADGDALIMDTAVLLDILGYIRTKCPNTRRVGVYANTKSILRKTGEELQALKEAGLGIVYHGVESGNRDVLIRIRKGATPEGMAEAADKITAAGIELSQMVLLGIAGADAAESEEHAADTGRLLSRMSPDYAAALTVMLVPGTVLAEAAAAGRFCLPDKRGIIRELRLIVEHFQPTRPCLFTSNHASNYLPIRARFPAERAQTLALIDSVLADTTDAALRPDYLRAL